MIPAIDWDLRQGVGVGMIRGTQSWRIGIQPDRRFPIPAIPSDEIPAEPRKRLCALQFSARQNRFLFFWQCHLNRIATRAVWVLKTLFGRRLRNSGMGAKQIPVAGLSSPFFRIVTNDEFSRLCRHFCRFCLVQSDRDRASFCLGLPMFHPCLPTALRSLSR